MNCKEKQVKDFGYNFCEVCGDRFLREDLFVIDSEECSWIVCEVHCDLMNKKEIKICNCPICMV